MVDSQKQLPRRFVDVTPSFQLINVGGLRGILYSNHAYTCAERSQGG